MPAGKTPLHRPSSRLVLSLAICLGSLVPVRAHGQNPIQGTNWFPIGPADFSSGQTYGDGRINASGRASVIAANPANPNDVWLGTATGGVWHSTNGGTNWLPMSDNEASLSIGALALDGCVAQGCATIYAGTGENSIRRDTYYGMGLLVGQMSGGEFPTFFWTLKGSKFFRFASINNVLLDPTTSGGSKTIYVSLSSGVTASATESTVTAPEPTKGYGIYKSTDQGNNWTELTVHGAHGFKPTDLEMDPTNPQILYAGFLGRGLFKSTNGGTSWCALNPGVPLAGGCVAATGLPNPTTTTFDHVEISIFRPSAATPAVLYTILGNCPDPIGNGSVPGGSCSPPIFKSTDNGQTWTQTNPAAPASYSRYTHVLTIHPSDSATIYYGGLQLFKSTDSGQTFTGLGNNVHPDHHALIFPDSSNPSRLYNASDGGFASSVNGGASWTSGNSDLQITGFQSMSWSPLTARVIGGSQDNGTEMWLGTRIWEHRDDGDSASTLMDRDNVLTMYDVYFDVDPRRSTDGGSCCYWPSITNGLTTGDPSTVYPPLAQGPGAHPLYFGTNRLYKTTDDGSTWTPVSPVLGGAGTVFPDIQRTNVITAIAPAPSNGNRIYVGYYDGKIFVTDSACTTAACWTAIGGAAKGLPTSVVTRIAVDPASPDIAYATFSGFANGPHVFKTSNKGSSWTNASNGLPPIPMNTITIETGSIAWVGADDGVYRSQDGGSNWTRYGVGLPHVPVYEIALDSDRGRLYAGTHGRGAWILTRPFLSNFEGWVNNDIWDIPVYGSGFVGSLTNPPGSPCTMQIIQQNGAVCSSSTTDAMGGTITFDSSGALVTSKSSFYNGKPVAWACFNGSCIGGKTIAACNPPSNPITSVTVTCGTQVGIDHILGCPAQANPPSSVLGLSGMPAGGGGGGAGGGGGLNAGGSDGGSGGAEEGEGDVHGGAAPVDKPAPRAAPSTALEAPTAPNSAPLAHGASFELIPTIQGRDGTRALCTAKVSLDAGDTPIQALLKARDAVNGSTACQQEPVKAIVSGIPPENQKGEDLLESPPNLKIRAPNAVGGQLITSIRAAAGAATDTCFDVSGIGSPLLNQVVVMKIELDTPSGGAAGGELTVLERSSLGACFVRVKTDPGESAAQIANAVMNAFQAPGLPGPASCPAAQNPRDITVEGSQIISVLASELRVCTTDPGLGLFIGPKELGSTSRLGLQYAVKVLCGPSELREDPAKPSGARPDRRVAPGRYFTAVNIHNPSERPVPARFKVAVALPGKPGPISRFVNFRLGPDEAISIDCTQLLDRLGVTSGFTDGFIVIESEAELDVVAVYTAAGATGKVETLKTERVPGRLR
jgi:photosystem II stability/assembly factor-like uncharacterized protein